MTFLTFWSKFRDDLHYPKESSVAQLKRISKTPPEFWSGKDWMESRRHRFLYQKGLEDANKNGLSQIRLRKISAAGRYWPNTPKFDQGFLDDVLHQRFWRERLHQIDAYVRAAGYADWDFDENGNLVVYGSPQVHSNHW
ncbi:hypothetical protein LOZ53_005164 [Ophidiomyces ophidiicola]|nr:hypothetical protein LOZ55_005201 [Ophidiomyces ophidiicola]KAI1985141.1 hypothetical protein LOZ53_005164 [Ophidiomyces ophidiicola]KAI1995936.1 hypothetical protein LOZ54_000427 [Ophidiomyces ophidiicola]KAI1997930.1 hypothetical protein LOZ51_002602 [Ophidiomyces ophidiicola]